MARFYARFDSGSAGWETELDNDYFERRRIAASSASAALLRDGLIASRSLLSTDVYQDLDDVNRNGARGTYFPPNSPVFTTDNSTFLSWSSAYTSSTEGIKTPVTPSLNTYGSTAVVNYSLRPTASVLSTSTNLITASSPLDSAGVSFNTYRSASNAVRAVLDAIQDGGGVGNSPFTRTGNNPSRTGHSIWNNPNLQYFAWDDFTPSQPTVNAVSFYSGDTPSSSLGYIIFSATASFKNDWNQLASSSLVATLVYATSSNGQFTGPNSIHKSLTVSFRNSTWTASSNAQAFSHRWNPGAVIKANGNLIDAQSSDGLQLNLSVTLYDPIITSSGGTAGTVTKNNGANITVNGTAITNGGFIKVGTT
jgi:hypothetical protein